MAKVLSGTEISKQILSQLEKEVAEIRQHKPEFRAKLIIVQVGDREDSNVYIRMKLKAAHGIGAEAELMKFSKSVTQDELLHVISQLNADASVHGIIVQLPLDCEKPIDAAKITNAVSTLKDVDGIHVENAGRLANGELENFFISCTPRACLELLLRTGVEICGKHAIVIGRSKVVGAPMAALLLSYFATVTVCHIKTQKIDEVCRLGDIVVVACGCPRLVKKHWIKPGAIVIDCGITSIEDPSHPKGRRIVGDVDYEAVKEVASWITPVPGGVGPMTVAMLIKNTVISAKREIVGSLQNNLHV